MLMYRGNSFRYSFHFKKAGNKLPDTIDQLFKHTVYTEQRWIEI